MNMEMNMNKSRALRREISQVLHEFHYKTDKIAVELYGVLYYLNEAQIRALQILVKRAADKSDEAFKELTDNIIVYSGRHKRQSKYTMNFRKDGGFEEKFEPGFCDTVSNLSMEIIRAGFRIKKANKNNN